jgi:hypothetical protein
VSIEEFTEQAIYMNVAFAPFSALYVEFQVRVGESSLSDVIQGGSGDGCASKIGVQDNSRGIDDRLQRVTQRLAKLARDGIGNSGKRQINGCGIKLFRIDFGAETSENGAGGVVDRGRAIP